MTTLETKYYTYPETAKILRCSEKTLYNRVKAGQIHPLHNGRLVLFTDECIKEFLHRNNSNAPCMLTDKS